MARIFDTIPALTRLPDIAAMYFKMPWLFDSILLGVTLALLMRKLGERVKIGTKLGTWLGVAMGFLTVVWMYRRGMNLVDLGPWIILFIIILFSIFIYLCLQEFKDQKIMNACIAIVLAFIFTGLLLSATPVGDLVKDIFGLIFWIAMIILILGLVMGMGAVGFQFGRPGGGWAGTAARGAAGWVGNAAKNAGGIFKGINDWRKRKKAAKKAKKGKPDLLTPTVDAGEKGKKILESIDAVIRALQEVRRQLNLGKVAGDICNNKLLRGLIKHLEDYGKELERVGEMTDTEQRTIRNWRESALKLIQELANTLSPGAMTAFTDALASNIGDFQDLQQSVDAIKTALTNAEATLAGLDPRVADPGKEAEFTKRRQDIADAINVVKATGAVAHLETPLTDALKNISVIDSDALNASWSALCTNRDAIANEIKEIAAALESLAAAKGTEAASIIEKNNLAIEKAKNLITPGQAFERTCADGHINTYTYEKALAGVKANAASWNKVFPTLQAQLNAISTNLAQLQTDIAAQLAKESEAEKAKDEEAAAKEIASIEDVRSKVAEQKAILEDILKKHTDLLDAITRGMGGDAKVTKAPDAQKAAAAQIIEKIKTELSELKVEEAKITEVRQAVRLASQSLAALLTAGEGGADTAALQKLLSNLQAFDKLEDQQLMPFIVNFEAVLSKTIKDILEERAKHTTVNAITITLSTELKALEKAIQLLETELALLGKAKTEAKKRPAKKAKAKKKAPSGKSKMTGGRATIEEGVYHIKPVKKK